MNKQKSIYEVQFEIAGPAAMFTRPDTGATPVSYPAPTYSAAKGMFESIARINSAYIKPTKSRFARLFVTTVIPQTTVDP